MMNKTPQGFILVSVTVVLGVLLLLAFYFLDFVTTDSKISISQNFSTQTYYSTEAGIQEAIWKIKNDPGWNNSFQTDPGWRATITREDIFDNGVSYDVTVANTGLGEAEITTTGLNDSGESQAQRVVKTKIFQALNPEPLDDILLFADHNIGFSGASLEFTNGGIFANNNIEATFFSEINIGLDAYAVNNITTSWNSSINANDYHAANFPPPADQVEMPQIDFDSADPASFLSRADNVYTANQFSNLMVGQPNLTLSGITYVTGNIVIPRGQVLNVSGVLVADGNISIGTEFWPFWKSGPFLSVSAAGSNPSGILTKKNLNFGSYADHIGVSGLIYAYNTVTIDALNIDLVINGGIICRNFSLLNLWDDLNFTYDKPKIDATLGNPLASPIINIEHWEEEY